MGTRVGSGSRPKVARWQRFWAHWREDLLAGGAFLVALAVGYVAILIVGAR